MNKNYNERHYTGYSKVLLYLQSIPVHSIFSINDLFNVNDITYTHIRSIIVRLHERGEIKRISRGLYCNTKSTDTYFPSFEEIVDYLAKNESFDYYPIGEYERYKNGDIKELPKVIVFHTTGKTRYLNLENGYSIKLHIHKKIRNI